MFQKYDLRVNFNARLSQCFNKIAIFKNLGIKLFMYLNAKNEMLLKNLIKSEINWINAIILLNKLLFAGLI